MAGPRFQFSIRRLLAVTTVVAATVGALAAEPGRVSGAVLLLLAAAFPAVYAAGLIGKSGCWKAFCAGAIIPAGIAFELTMVGLVSVLYPPGSWTGPPFSGPQPGVLDALEIATRDPVPRTYRAIYWLAMMIVGTAAAGFCGLARANSPQENDRKARRASLVRLAMFWLVLITAAIGALAAERNRYAGSAMILLVGVFLAALAAGLVESQGAAKAFCAGAILPAGIALYVIVAHFYSLDTLEEIPLLCDAIEEIMMNTELKPFIGLFWAATAIMGLASAGAYRAFVSDSPQQR